MKKIKYDVGDTVILKTWQEMKKEYGLEDNNICVPASFTAEMEKALDETREVVLISTNWTSWFNGKFPDGSSWIISPEMISKVSKKTIPNKQTNHFWVLQEKETKKYVVDETFFTKSLIKCTWYTSRQEARDNKLSNEKVVKINVTVEQV